MHTQLLLAAGVVAVLGTTWASGDDAWFVGLGCPFPGDCEALAWGISADGGTVVGEVVWSVSVYEGPFVWTAATGTVAIGCLPGHTRGYATSVNSDGTIVVGSSMNDLSQEAFRWSPTGGMIGLGSLDPDRSSGRAHDVSADGRVIVGGCWSAAYDEFEPFRWGAEEDMIGLGLLPNCRSGEATDISGDGLVVVGRCEPNGWALPKGFRWTAAEGMTLFEPGVPVDVSFDGRVIIGRYFRWTEGTGAITLDNPPGGFDGPWLHAVSADGRVIVGSAMTIYGEAAFVWDARHGTRNLQDVLVDDYGLDLTDWQLECATGVSADGTTITGWGTDPDHRWEAWVARIPAPCIGDLDDDDFIGLSDLTQLLANYGMSDGAAYADGDLDADGDVDLSDLAALLPDYGTDCP